ncbi:MAG: glycosyltransferase family 4 protein [Deltaproteobacteria bacterium]|nr:glycosyltransferase family 4 protein [Deltaproteobacteria bacterium]
MGRTGLRDPAGVEAGPSQQPTGQHILACVGSMTCGGAERVLAILTSEWASRGDRVSLMTLSGASSFYPLHPAVELVALGVSGGGPRWAAPWRIGRRIRALRETIIDLQPTVVVSFIDRMNVQVVGAALGLGVPTVVSERVQPGPLDPRGWRWVRAAAYSRASMVVAQTERMATVLRSPVAPPVRTIPNPVSEARRRARPAASQNLVAVGRLAPQKGFDLLIEAFRRADIPGWNLTIHGEGGERAALEKQVVEAGLTGRVSLPGSHPDVMSAMADAGAFVLSSRFEGFPNALCEAMAVGLPVVATRCPTGPEEIIRDEHDGLLVPVDDAGAMAASLRRLAGDPELRARLGDRAREVAQRFSVSSVVSQWDDAIRAVTR